MRVILDTSVIVSGLISPHSPPAKVVELWQQGTIQLLYSAEIFAELQDVLHRQWLQQRLAHRPNRISDFLTSVVILGEIVSGAFDVSGQVRDPNDEMFLTCAVLGSADYLISGDKDLLTLGSFGPTQIVSPADFLLVMGR